MRTILILSKSPSTAAAVEGVLDKAKYQVIAKEDIWSAESLLSRGAIDGLILDVELTGAQAIRTIEQARGAAPETPLIVVSSAKSWEWEEDAFLLGVSQIIAKPIRPKLLNNLLDRIFEAPATTAPLAS